MKLFFVTGIANSNWSHIADALQTPCQEVSDNSFSKIKETNIRMLEQGSSNAKTIDEVLHTLKDGRPSILADEDIFSSLNYWAKSSAIQFVVFYCAPQVALANALQERGLSNDECIDLLSSWSKQTKDAYEFYLQHKTQCLLLDVQSIVENRRDATREMSAFLKHESSLKKVSLNIAADARLSANLLMIDQDEAFELYDEVRSTAPLLGKLTLSGAEELSSLTDDALGIIRAKHDEQQNNQQNIHNLESSLAENFEKLRLLQVDHATAVNVSSKKINELALAKSECEEKLTITTSQADNDKQALQQKIVKLEQLLAKNKQNHDEAYKTHRQTTTELKQKVSDLQARVTEVKDAHENELAAKAAVQQELAENKQAHDEAYKTHEQTTAALKRNISDLQSRVTEVKDAHENELAAKIAVQQKLAENKQAHGEACKTHEQTTAALKQKIADLQARVTKVKEVHDETLKSQAELNKKHAARVSVLDNKLSEAKSEEELFVLQVAQLQEELEGSHSASIASQGKLVEQVKQLQQKLQTQKNEVTDLRQQHAILVDLEAKKLAAALTKNSELVGELKQKRSERELLVLEKEQLQEELESLYQTNKELNDKRAKYGANIADLQQRVANIPALEAENEKAGLRVTQLQEKFESLSEINKNLNEKDIKHVGNIAELHQRIANIPALEAENKIAVLQIDQLQEELEFYYLQLQEKGANKMQHTPTIDRLTQDVFAKCQIESFDVVGGYDDDGYKDIQLVLHGVELADGRHFDQFAVKLIEADGRVGLEFRPPENITTDQPLNWRDDMQDEYGAFIKFIPNPTESQASQQQKTIESLSASERLLILSVANTLSDTLQQTHSAIGDLQDGKLRDWKLVALRLKYQVAKLPEWLSFDAISLIEEMQTDNYEHLWISFDNLLVNNHLYPNFKLKFAALGPLNEESLFTGTLMLELREQDNDGAPLQAWPPMAQDEYGFKLQANIDLQGDELVLKVDENLSEHDKQFLRHLAKNFVHFIYALTQQNIIFERNTDHWLSVANRVNELGQSKTKSSDNEELTPDLELKLDFQEYVDLGGYQHIVYKTDFGEGQSLLMKLRAENINPATKIADMSLELRTGDASVPLAETMFFGEDDYGPRVLIAFDDLVSDNFAQYESTLGGKIVQTFISKINDLIENDSTLDTEQQALWIGLLAKEQQ
jgi:hypothetical protein